MEDGMIKDFLRKFSGSKETKEYHLNWSSNPGCFERHLHRRFQNPLFSKERMQVTEEELKQAQSTDNNDQKFFKNEKLIFEQKISPLISGEFDVQFYQRNSGFN